MKKIIINGFPHSGTTILRRIIGDHPDVLDHEPEVYDFPDIIITDPGNYTHIVCKFVGLPIQLYPYDVTRIWIIKNPWDVFGSFVRRFGDQWKTMPNYQLKDYLYFAERWCFERTEDLDWTVRYEDIFSEEKYIGWIFDRLELDQIAQGDRKAGMGSRAEIPNEEPPRYMSMDFRTWQINQPLQNMTYHSAPWCPLEILKTLGDYSIIQDVGYNMAKVDGLWFPVGSQLTGKENGQLIIATPGTDPELILGTVTKEGLKYEPK